MVGKGSDSTCRGDTDNDDKRSPALTFSMSRLNFSRAAA